MGLRRRVGKGRWRGTRRATRMVKRDWYVWVLDEKGYCLDCDDGLLM